VAVAPHQPVTPLVARLGTGGDLGIDLGLQRHRQHPAGTLAEQFVQIQCQLGSCLPVGNYTQHRGVPSSPAFTAPASFLLVRVEGTPRSHAKGSSTVFDDISAASSW
jgi:hypothetical protein